MAKKPETVTGRWPVAVRDHEGTRVAPGEPATVLKARADEFDARFGRLPEPAQPVARRAADPSPE